MFYIGQLLSYDKKLYNFQCHTCDKNRTILSYDIVVDIECTKFVFGRGSAPEFAGGSYSAPPNPVDALRGPTCKRREDGEGRGKVRGGIREGKRTPPNANSRSDAAAPHVYNTPTSIPAYVHAAC